MRNVVWFLLLIGVVLSMPAVAMAAQEPESSSSGFYMTPSVSFMGVQLPNYAPMAERDVIVGNNRLVSRLETFGGEAFGTQTELVLGTNFETSLFSADALFVELRPFYSQAAAKNTGLFKGNSAFRNGWYLLDGSNSVSFPTGEGASATTDFDMEHYGGEMRIGLEYDLEEYVIRSYVGYSGMRLEQDYSTRAYKVTDPSEYLELDEQSVGVYHGLVVGSELRWKGQSYEPYLTGSVAAFLLDASYKGESISKTVATRYSERALHTTGQDGSVQLRLGGGVDRKYDDWTVGFTSNVEYLNSVPRIIAGTRNSTAASRDEPLTRLDFIGSLSLKTGLNISYEF